MTKSKNEKATANKGQKSSSKALTAKQIHGSNARHRSGSARDRWAAVPGESQSRTARIHAGSDNGFRRYARKKPRRETKDPRPPTGDRDR